MIFLSPKLDTQTFDNGEYGKINILKQVDLKVVENLNFFQEQD